MNIRPATNITLLERQFDSIIMNSQDGDGSGLLSSRSFTRWTFTFHDSTKLRVTEHLINGNIEMYFYNWADTEGNTILKFHNEPHDKDKRYQTKTEPFHVHPPNESKVHNVTRYPNYHHQELTQILEFIFLHLVASGKV